MNKIQISNKKLEKEVIRHALMKSAKLKCMFIVMFVHNVKVNNLYIINLKINFSKKIQMIKASEKSPETFMSLT